jgi:hypothetical protein
MGYKTDIILRDTHLSKMNAPFSNCLKDTTSPDSHPSAIYKKILSSNHSYKQDTCLEVVLQNYIYDECKCVNGYLINLYKYPVCSEIASQKCNFRRRIKFTSESIMKQNFHLCPYECDSEIYSFESLHSNFPSDSYLQLIKRHPVVVSKFANQTDELVKSSVLRVLIYFNDLRYTQITESPSMTFLTLVSNIGGILGLFLGFSLLSLVEIIELMIELCLTFITRDFNKIESF